MTTSYSFLDCRCVDGNGEEIRIPAGVWAVTYSGPMATIAAGDRSIQIFRITLDQLQREKKASPAA